jgi:hypothetical protein
MALIREPDGSVTIDDEVPTRWVTSGSLIHRGTLTYESYPRRPIIEHRSLQEARAKFEEKYH